MALATGSGGITVVRHFEQTFLCLGQQVLRRTAGVNRKRALSHEAEVMGSGQGRLLTSKGRWILGLSPRCPVMVLKSMTLGKHFNLFVF